MSAYVVSKDHIVYLVCAAMHRRIIQTGAFSWYYGDGGNRRRKELTCADYSEAVKTGNMLWAENIRSVGFLYSTKDPFDLPGPVDESFILSEKDIYWPDSPEPLQVIMACKCYEYQSCEHPGWNGSSSKSFIDGLKDAAVTAIPGWDNLAWGAPPRRVALETNPGLFYD